MDEKIPNWTASVKEIKRLAQPKSTSTAAGVFAIKRLRGTVSTNHYNHMPQRFRSTCPLGNVSVDAPLNCSQCEGTTRAGNPCSRNVCIGRGLCWQHTRSTYHVRIAPSSIPGAGKGLFCFVPGGGNQIVFRGNNLQSRWICPYGGEKVTSAQLDDRYGDCTAPYGVGDRDSEDGALHRGIGSMANGQLLRAQCNAEYAMRTGANAGWWLRTIPTRNIRNGAEIVCHYGTSYYGTDASPAQFCNHSTR